jgi:lysozyme family protein
MQANFPAALALVLKDEGGYVDNPADPGGATNLGITLRTLAAWRGIATLPKSEVLNLTVAEAGKIYKARYWDAIRGDDLPIGLDYAVFDYAVNSGPTAAARALQHVLSVPMDGVIGPITLAAANKSPTTAILMLCANRLQFLEGLSTWGAFGNGWSARVSRVKAAALAMVTASPAAPVPYPPLPSPAPVGGKIIITPPVARKFDLAAIIAAVLSFIAALFKRKLP